MSMFGRKHKFSGSEDGGVEEVSLQITSMADIFTIILVFMLKSFSTGLASITPANGITLPSITTPSEAEIKEALKIEVLPDAILVDQKQVVRTSNFLRGDENDSRPENPGALQSMPQSPPQSPDDPVYLSLLEERRKFTAADGSLDTNLLLLADERTPYSSLQRIMASAASAGFLDLQLVVVEAN